MTEYAIQATNLGKTYNSNGDKIVALQDLSLSIEAGEIYALLGPNGAGKTTTISILTTLVAPSSGQASIAGFDIDAQAEQVRRHIGVTFQEMVLDEDLTGRQVLDFHGRLYGLSKSVRGNRIDELSTMVDLNDALDRRVVQYSGGMKRRLELARGLMTSPDVLFLDEPTQGLDPQNRISVWEYITQMRDESGLALMLTTHYMDEAATLADRVGIIDHGNLIVEGTPEQLVQEMGADVVTLRVANTSVKLADRYRELPYVSQLVEHSESETEAAPAVESTSMKRIQVGVDNGDHRLPELIGIAVEEGVNISDVRVSRPSLADVFLAYTGHALRDT